MKQKGIYRNLENILKVFKITRQELAENLDVNINTITRMLAISSSISISNAMKIRDYIELKTGTKFDIEFLFARE